MENFLDGHEFKSGQNFEDFFNFSYVPLQESQIPEARDLSNQLVNPQFQVLPQTVQTNPQAPIQQVIPPPKKEVKTESKQEETSSYKTSSSLNLPLMPKQDKDICLIDLPDDELIREIKDMYPTMSQKNMNELLRKRKEISQVLHGSTSELHAVIQNYQTKFLQLLHEEEQNRRVSEQEKQEKIAKFNEKITFYQVEMKKACEAVFRQLVIKLGKRRNRSLPPEATAVLKEWFLDHYKVRSNLYLNICSSSSSIPIQLKRRRKNFKIKHNLRQHR